METYWLVGFRGSPLTQHIDIKEKGQESYGRSNGGTSPRSF